MLPTIWNVGIAVLAGLLCVGSQAQKKPEPRYEGKPLAYWVERLQKAEKNDELNAAAEAIKAFGPDAAPAVPALVEMLDDRSEYFRITIGDILCELGPVAKSAVPALIASLKDQTARSPELVIKILGCIGPDARDAMPVLLIDLENRQLTDAAVKALCAIQPPAKDVIPAIRHAIRDAQAHEQERVFASFSLLEPLPQLGVDAVPLLLEFIHEKDPNFLESSARALGAIGPSAKPATRELTELLRHDVPDVRLHAAIALWKIEKNPAVVPALAALLKEQARYLAEPAAQTLGDIGREAKPALPDLQKALAHDMPGVPDAASEAIRKIDPENAPKILAGHEKGCWWSPTGTGN